MKYGLKIKSLNKKLLLKAVQLCESKDFEYIEIHVIPGVFKNYIDIIKNLNVPIVLHAPYQIEGLNISTKLNSNTDVFTKVLKYADQTNAMHIIVHPGVDGTLENVISFLSNYKDSRILVENLPKFALINKNHLARILPKPILKAIALPYKLFPLKMQSTINKSLITGEKLTCIGYSPKSINQIMDATKVGFCLDFGHAYKAAYSLEKDYKIFIKKFLKLGPKLFHIHDGLAEEEYDRHMSIGDGNYDMGFIYNCVDRYNDKYATFETPRIKLDSFEEDLSNKLSFDKFNIN